MLKRSYKTISIILTFYFSLLFAGCATTPYAISTPISTLPGIYHRIERGQTLWRLSKLYNVSLEELIRVNHINDAARIEIGQLIFIPHQQKPHHFSYKTLASDDFIWPIKGKVIALFGQTHYNMINRGINIKPEKEQVVTAARSGKVIFYTDDFEGFGKTIIIDHGDGFSTVYTRNSEVFIKVGDDIQKGSVIAKVGSAGRDKNTYLHFQIRKGHIPQNPLFYLP